MIGHGSLRSFHCLPRFSLQKVAFPTARLAGDSSPYLRERSTGFIRRRAAIGFGKEGLGIIGEEKERTREEGNILDDETAGTAQKREAVLAATKIRYPALG